jgi:hypothetical protein
MAANPLLSVRSLFTLIQQFCIATVLVFALGVPTYFSIKTGLLIVMVFAIVVPSVPRLDGVSSFAINVIKTFLALSVVSVAWVLIASTDRVVFQLAALFISGHHKFQNYIPSLERSSTSPVKAVRSNLRS